MKKLKKVRIAPKRCRDQYCCCNCRYLAPDAHRNWSQGIRVKGYVCLAPELPFVFSNHPEHGLCEMWELRPKEWPKYE